MSKRSFDESDQEYLFEQLCKRIGTRKLMNMFQKDIERMEETHISTFNVTLLAHVLSFVERSDVNAVSRVCKKWNAAFKLPNFWKQHILAKFKLLPKHALAEKFDNFFFSNQETLQQQLEWLFVNGWHLTSVDPLDATDLQITRKSNSRWAVSWIYPSTYIRHEFTGTLTLSGDAKVVILNPQDSRYERIEYNTTYFAAARKYGRDTVQMTCKKMDGSKWEGQGTNTLTVHPHGMGTWTFPNGDIFRGVDVAFAGEPHGVGHDQDGKEIEYFAGKRIR